MKDRRELAGRVALVTGVSRRAGIGAAIAKELARAGANVFVTFFRHYDQSKPWGIDSGEPEAVLDELGAFSDVSGVELDLSLPSAPREVVRLCIARFGRLDILVNNAAHWEAGGLDEVSADQLDRHYAVNTRAAVLLCAEFARCTSPLGSGRIVNVTSGQSSGPMPGELAYVVTKASLDALTLTLSAELAPRRITINAVDPGPTDTGWISAEQRLELIRSSINGTIALPDDTAKVVRLLASDEAASVTGQLIRVRPGGMAP